MYERFCHGCETPDQEIIHSQDPEVGDSCECGSSDLESIDIDWILQQMDDAIVALKADYSREHSNLSRRLQVVRDIVHGELDTFPNHNDFYVKKISQLKKEKMLLNMECNRLFNKLYPNHPGDLT